MPEHQLIEKMKNIAKRNIFSFVSFRSGLNIKLLYIGACRLAFGLCKMYEYKWGEIPFFGSVPAFG